MTARDHERMREDVGAYLLGALEQAELTAFEAHLEHCHVCREDVERLRLAVDALPRSVEQFEAPPSLKRSLMETVEAEAAERGQAAGAEASEPDRSLAERRERRTLRERFAGTLTARPRAALVAAALMLAVAGGFGIAQLVDQGPESRTLAGAVDQRRAPGGEAQLRVEGDGSGGGILRVERFRQLPPGRTYQAWTESGGRITPAPTFEVGADGRGAVALPADLEDVENVYISREPRGGSTAPSEVPIVQVEL